MIGHSLIYSSIPRPSFYIRFPHFPFVSSVRTDWQLATVIQSFNHSPFIMLLPSTALVSLFLSYAHLIACHDPLHPRVACSSSYTACNPKGAATTNEPPIGTAIAPLFLDVVDTLDSANLAKRQLGRDHGVIETRASGGSVCCMYLVSVISIVNVDLLQRCRRNHMSSAPGV